MRQFKQQVSRLYSFWSLVTVFGMFTLAGCSTILEPQQALDAELENYWEIESPTSQQTLVMKTKLAQSEHRSAWATASLARMYSQPTATAEEKFQALALYDQAIKQGYIHAGTIAYVADQHISGRLPNSDKMKGYEYLRMAANLYDEWAQYHVAKMMLTGNGDLQLPVIAKSSMLYIAEDNVDFQAWACIITYSYHFDKTCVEKILLPNANSKSPYALLGAGIAYENGWYVTKDQDKAADFYRQAVSVGVKQGEHFLARLPSDSVDDNQAKYWQPNSKQLMSSGKLLPDGSFIVPDGYTLVAASDGHFIQDNLEQVWPSHCGWVLQRSSAEAYVVINQSKFDCVPSDQDIELLQNYGVDQVVHNYGATAVLLKNGQVITWGHQLVGGYLLAEAQWHKDQAKSWQDLLALYRAMEQDVVDIASLQSGFLALTKSGDIWQWAKGKTVKVEGKYRQLLGGYNGVDGCGLTIDGTVNCWLERSPDKLTSIVKGLKSALSTPYLRSGYGFGIIGIRDGEFEGMLTSWYVSYGSSDFDRAIAYNDDILEHNWRDLRLGKTGSILATNENGGVAEFYYTGDNTYRGSYRFMFSDD
ncbi:hypothetical protein C1M56_01860 [Vibrio diazotrophicus]|jgi:TPR repeat protein|nr:hypothetical protein C1M56_01860 [Vibrio diazotrophicus]